MASTIEDLESAINQAIAPGFRGRLLDRGQARSMIWKDGVLPPNAPRFSPDLSYDLLSYGYSLLGMGMRLREMDGTPEIYQAALKKLHLQLNMSSSRLILMMLHMHFTISWQHLRTILLNILQKHTHYCVVLSMKKILALLKEVCAE